MVRSYNYQESNISDLIHYLVDESMACDLMIYKQTLPSFLLCCCTISSMEYKDSSFTLTSFHFQFFSLSIHSKIK